MDSITETEVIQMMSDMIDKLFLELLDLGEINDSDLTELERIAKILAERD